MDKEKARKVLSIFCCILVDLLAREFTRMEITSCPHCGGKLQQKQSEQEQENAEQGQNLGSVLNPHNNDQKQESKKTKKKEEEQSQEMDDEEAKPSKVVQQSQEPKKANPVQGRVVVQYPFEKGQYPLFRDTPWKYSRTLSSLEYN